MRSILCFLPIVGVLVSGCDKRDSATGPVASGAPAASTVGAGPRPPVASGAPTMTTARPLDQPPGAPTLELLKKVVLEIDFYTPKAEHKPIEDVLAQAKAKLGEPTYVAKDTYAWGAITAEQCVCFQIEDKGGKAYSDGVVSADFNGGHNQAYGECLVKLGKKPGKAP